MNTIENAKEIISSYKREDGKKLRIMEVCGTHTHEIFRLGIRKLLPEYRNEPSRSKVKGCDHKDSLFPT